MFSFAYPELLLLLLLVPLFVVIYVWARYTRRKQLARFGLLKVLRPLMPEVSPYKPPLKITLRMLALAALILAFARPRGGLKDEKTDKRGIEVMIAVDASNSMLASANDRPDGPQRMRSTKLMLEKLVNSFHNDRVGLIVYAANAYSLVPITSDYVSARMFLNNIDPSIITEQGTNIAEAINSSMSSFSADKKVGKAIVLITDAEDLEDKEGAINAAKNAAKNGIQVDVIGVGSTTPVPIPYNGSYITDPDTGQPAMTAIDENLATEIAKAGKGIYVNASNSDALPELQHQLSTLKKSSMKASVYALHDELFTIFLWIGLAFLLLDIFTLERKISWLDKITFFKKEEKA